MSVQTMSSTPCPAWCTAHTGFEDGSDDWHATPELSLGGHDFFVSTGTLTGEPEVFIDDHEGIPLDEAAALARAILEVVEAATS